MKKQSLQGDLYLLLTSAIWGFAFVAQRVGMDYIGPFFYNAVRFFLGAISLVLVVYLFSKEVKITLEGVKYGIILGAFLFLGASLQQVGIVYTTAGKAGFITGLYVIFTPIIGIFLGTRTHVYTWIGVIFATIGMYLLSVKEGIYIEKGDLLVLIGAIFWAFHVNYISVFIKKVSFYELSIVQYIACSIFSFIVALLFESVKFKMVNDAIIPILYGGLISVGVGYTLQIFAQKKTHPSHAAVLLSLESLFAVMGGWLFLNEILSFKEMVGCGFMLLAMFISQFGIIFNKGESR